MGDDYYLNSIDYAIIGLYLAVLVVLGFHLKRRASAGLEQYLLGNRSMPWWMLGVSGVMDFWDLAGTMIIVSFLFLLGPRGLFIEFRGGAVLVLAVAIAADRAGLDVLLTADTGTVTSLPHGPNLAADATAFLHEVSDDMVDPAEPGPQPWIRRAGESGPQLRPGVTFSGAALRNWAGSCLSSPYGWRSSRPFVTELIWTSHT